MNTNNEIAQSRKWTIFYSIDFFRNNIEKMIEIEKNKLDPIEDQLIKNYHEASSEERAKMTRNSMTKAFFALYEFNVLQTLYQLEKEGEIERQD